MPPASPIRLLLVDDHSMVRKGFALLLGVEPDLEVCGEAEDAAGAVAQYRRLRPDITLMDGRLPGANGIEALRQIRAEDPNARVIILTTYDLDEMISSALAAGAAGYLLKSVQCDELAAAIRRVHAGERCFPANVQARLAMGAANKKLSPREQEALDLLRRGLSNREIALALNVSENTAKAHLKGIFAKLGAAGRTEAVTLAFEHGLLDPSQR